MTTAFFFTGIFMLAGGLAFLSPDMSRRGKIIGAILFAVGFISIANMFFINHSVKLVKPSSYSSDENAGVITFIVNGEPVRSISYLHFKNAEHVMCEVVTTVYGKIVKESHVSKSLVVKVLE